MQQIGGVRMIVLHIAPINMAKANGFRFSVPGLVSAQNKINGVIAGLMNINSSDTLDSKEVEEFDFYFSKSYTEIKYLPKPYRHPDLVVFHGIYLFKYIKIYKILVGHNIPYIIVPRGSLTDGAQRQKFLKKVIGNILFFNKFINNAKKIHFLTKNEKEASKKFKNNNFVVGNGIHMPILNKKYISQNLKITFIGRYDVNHKGLDILIESLINIKDDLLSQNTTINLYGSDHRGGKEYIKNQIRINSLQDILKINNEVFGDKKHNVLLQTDIFITTSRFEGHPMAVLEAMAYGIPCILTEGTNMLNKMNQYNAGWSTTLDAITIGDTILTAIASKEKIFRKGINARKLIEENYTWSKVAENTVKNYKKIFN